MKEGGWLDRLLRGPVSTRAKARDEARNRENVAHVAVVQALTGPSFEACIHAHESQDTETPEFIHRAVRSAFDAMIATAPTLGIEKRATYDILAALTSLIDECMLRDSSGPRQYWTSRPTDMHYFHSATAGDKFFRVLEHAMTEEPVRLQMVWVFHTCLEMGFKGIYSLRGREEALQLVRSRVADKLRANGIGVECAYPVIITSTRGARFVAPDREPLPTRGTRA